jgi:MYXO-CTERM domain-containing protein
MVRVLRIVLVAGFLSLVATPASAIPFGVEANGGLGTWTVWNNGSMVASGHWAGSGGGSYDVAPGLVSWGVGGIFCPCSWSMTLGGTTIAGGSRWGGGFLNFGRTTVSATDDTALKVREPTFLALLGLALFGVWIAKRRRNRPRVS